MIIRYVLSLCVLSVATAFHVQPRVAVIAPRRLGATGGAATDEPSINFKRAKECAENFGKCSVEEIEDLRAKLHEERIESFGLAAEPNTYPASESLEHLVLEEELEAQLKMLKAKTPNPNLFPEVEDDMEQLPHLKDNTISKKAQKVVHDAELMALEQESVLDEETLETIMICAVIAGLVLLPQLFHF